VALLATGLSWWLLAGNAEAAGPPTNITVVLSPSVFIANGTSKTIATATVTDLTGAGVPGDQLSFSSSDPGQTVGPVTDNGNGTYTATITSSTTVGSATITAKDTSVTPNLMATASLTQTSDPASAITLAVQPGSIVADGSSKSTATATVTDAVGAGVSGEKIGFSSSDPGETIGPVTDNGSGTYTATITSSTTIGFATITATDTSVTPNLSARAAVTETAIPTGTSLAVSGDTLVTNQSVTLAAAATSGTGSPPGTITFQNHGARIRGCPTQRVAPPSSVIATCQTTFAASTSPELLTAVFTPDGSNVAGSAGTATVQVSRDSSLISVDASKTANVGASTTYTATVTPPASRPGPIEPSGSVEFFDGGQPIASCLSQKLLKGGATCTATYKARGTHSITARYRGDDNFTGSTSPAQPVSVVPVPVQVLGTITSTMQWTFLYTPAYTKVLALVVNGASTGATVLVKCHGLGCPYAKHATPVTSASPCRRTGRRTCLPRGRIDLTVGFQRHRLRVGAKITVMITRPGWIGRYYMFAVRARRGPRIKISCLAPGGTRPVVGCR
jgi:hypothetical protein